MSPARLKQSSRRIAGAALLAAATWSALRADAQTPLVVPPPERDAQSTMSSAPRSHPSTAADNSGDRLRVVVLGASPTLAEPALTAGIAALGPGRKPTARGEAGARRTAWVDYMATPLMPAWSLRRINTARFGMDAAKRQALDASQPLAADPSSAGGQPLVRFGFGFALPADSTMRESTRAWTTLTDSASGAMLLPSTLTPLAQPTSADAAADLLWPHLAAPPSGAGAAVGATIAPAQKSR